MKKFIAEKFTKIKNNNLILNILSNLLLKGVGIILSFVSIPLTLKYLDNKFYGLWILILSITGWIYTFDIGIGNGLKNKLAESIAKKEEKIAKEYIATSYFFVIIISLTFFIMSFFFLEIFNMKSLLKIDILSRDSLNKILFINIGFVCLNFILALCNNIFLGSQKSYLTSINSVFSQILNIFFIIMLLISKKKSIVLLSIFYGAAISVSHLILTFYYFISNRELFFNLKDIKLKNSKNLLGIGIKIFIIQIASLIIFSTDNFIISRFLGIEKVAEYNIVNKFFSVPLIVFSLITAPIWPAVTKYYHEKNVVLIKKLLNKMKIVFYFLVIGVIILVVVGQYFIKLWTLGVIVASSSLIIACSLATILTMYSNIYSTFIFGIGVSWSIVYLSSIQALINLIVSYMAIKYFNLGIVGVVLGTCFAMSTNLLVLPRKLKNQLNNINNY